MEVKIGVSNRHIHLSREDLSLLFGDDYKLNIMKPLSQRENFSCVEVVSIENNGKVINDVRIVAPCREKTQLEISKTDAYFLGINPPYKNSGDLDGAQDITIRGPQGVIRRKCAIIANRHIHMNSKDARKLGYKNGDIVKVQLFGIKGGVLDNVYIRVSDNFNLELHLDLDDTNAHLLSNGDIAKII
ncbi:MAG: phosphate propanoyltransferase [Bacilli bacterium]|nr:phosphate propanoyltransferase [Bacilli bacterium]MBP3635587.1 phosphate propanoyltransferase [Bacilli bacterium]